MAKYYFLFALAPVPLSSFAYGKELALNAARTEVIEGINGGEFPEHLIASPIDSRFLILKDDGSLYAWGDPDGSDYNTRYDGFLSYGSVAFSGDGRYLVAEAKKPSNDLWENYKGAYIANLKTGDVKYLHKTISGARATVPHTHLAYFEVDFLGADTHLSLRNLATGQEVGRLPVPPINGEKFAHFPTIGFSENGNSFYALQQSVFHAPDLLTVRDFKSQKEIYRVQNEGHCSHRPSRVTADSCCILETMAVISLI